VFEGRRQLIAYYFMWQAGQPAEVQCEGCTFYTTQVGGLSYLHSRDVTYATLCQGPYDESVRYRDFMGWDMPWYSAQDSLHSLLAGRGPFMLACYLRQGDTLRRPHPAEVGDGLRVGLKPNPTVLPIGPLTLTRW
jgi:Bacterial protein of unknown function (DUF899)